MEIQTECMYYEERDYTISEIAKSMKEDKKITIEHYYMEESASTKVQEPNDLTKLKGIVVSVDQYSKYKFLIGEDGKIKGVITGRIPDMIEDYKNVEDFENELFEKDSNINDDNKEKEETIDIPILGDNIDTSNPIEITSYIAIKSNSKNTLNVEGIQNLNYQLEDATDNVSLTDGRIIASKNADSKDSCKIIITGIYEGQNYINHLIVLVEPKNKVTVIDKDGNEQQAYGIYNIQDLVRFKELVNNKVAVENYNAKIMDDIDLNSICQNKTVSWQPIGNYNENETIYVGIFDGNYKRIYNIFINEPTKRYQSFFGKIENSFIKNVTIEGNITGYQFTGGVVGYAVNSDVLNCINNVEIIAKFGATGGILGRGDDNMRIEKCINNRPIQQDGSVVGGIIGAARVLRNDAEFIITECINKGTITANGADEYDESFVGGIVGNNDGAIITNCYNTKAIYGKGVCVGGIAGCSTTEVANCYNLGNITGDTDNAGGIVGWTSKNVSNCINCGTINNEDITSLNLVGKSLGKWIGTIIGYTDNVAQAKNCLSIEKETLAGYTDEQIKSVLSNNFKKDEENKNEGLPILSWQ